MIKALIFDFDGTIIDTETAWYVAFREAYKEHGVDLTLDQYSECIGTSSTNFDPYEYLITELKLPIDRQLFRDSVNICHSKLMESEQIRSGVQHYLDSAKAAGLRIGLASSSSKEWVDKHLDQLGLHHYFDCIRTADDVLNVKPDPELYIQTLACLGVQANEAVAIEDSPNGAIAAKNAGMHCVITPNPLTETLEFDSAYHRVQSLSDLEFDHLISNIFVTSSEITK
jgi:putative hydrolase of the HAD superfamily